MPDETIEDIENQDEEILEDADGYPIKLNYEAWFERYGVKND